MKWTIALAAGLLSACAGSNSVAGPSSQPTAGTPAPAPFLAACKATCERQNMARAVAAEMITADCERSCAADLKLTLVKDKDGLAAAGAERVRVIGQLEGDTLVLVDGTKVPLTSGPALSAEALAPLKGKAAIVVGTVSEGALEYCTVVAAAK